MAGGRDGRHMSLSPSLCCFCRLQILSNEFPVQIFKWGLVGGHFEVIESMEHAPQMKKIEN